MGKCGLCQCVHEGPLILIFNMRNVLNLPYLIEKYYVQNEQGKHASELIDDLCRILRVVDVTLFVYLIS